MTTFFPCPYLRAEVELTEERQQHIEADHAEVLPALLVELAETIRAPDSVLKGRQGERALVRAWPNVFGGKQLFVVVVTDPLVSSEGVESRHWIVTAYVARRLPKWEVEWIPS